MSDADPLEQALADMRGQAGVLRFHGHHDQARALDEFASRIAEATPEYRTWLTESEAVDYTARSVEYLRNRFSGWAARGLARLSGGKRQYRRMALEHRGNIEAAREAGRRARSA